MPTDLSSYRPSRCSLDEYDVPWTNFLLAQAEAHQDWWGDASTSNSAAKQYLQWVTDRSTAQTTWQTNVANAFLQQATQRHGAARTEATAVADATRDKSVAEATAADNYLRGTAGLLNPAKTYLDDTAQAERDHAVALALAQYNRVARDDGSYSSDYWGQY